MERKIFFLFLSVVAIVFFSNCSRVETQSTPLNGETKTIEPDLLPTRTAPSTQTSIPNPQKTPTALPSISDETAKEVLIRFLQTNGGCELPCLLGLTPGVSDEDETAAFQLYFQHIKYPLDIQDNRVGIEPSTWNNGGGIWLQFWNNNLATNVSLDYYFGQNTIDQIVLTSWSNQYIENGAKSLYDDPNYKDILEYYSLANILDTYGPPSQILIAPFPDDPGHPSPPAQYSFSTTLIYAQKGFLIQYITIREQDDKYFISCPANSHIAVSTWVPDSNLDLASVVSYFSGVDSINSSNISYFQELEDVTAFDVNSFYETFKSSSTHNCIQTAKDSWPSP